ncbi:hypothetical protein GA0074696_5727 [Micromonospora purpureochromogenes]|uniref:Uncharacterized protein n=1 Tax=Micromonospora purpureochromogenes TaxID=47872 RepID=A0A1C5ACL4_9ACTN|nr:hypothetical protein [Micromonospora purpureochromogenes]SCF42816.1 hypothetical protein GA0074696_5727 [Micromonospora purpureochromogenes]
MGDGRGVWKAVADFFDPADVNPAYVVIWFLVAAGFVASHDELHYQLLGGALMLLAGVQLVRMAWRRLLRKKFRRRGGEAAYQDGSADE